MTAALSGFHPACANSAAPASPAAVRQHGRARSTGMPAVHHGLAWLCLCVSAGLLGCAGALPAAPEAPAAPPHFAEAAAQAVAAATPPGHSASAPAAATSGDAWWQVLALPQLDALQQRLAADHPSLAQAQARVAQARAQADLAAADGRPLLSLAAGASRQAGPLVNDAGTDGTLWRAGLNLQHTPDLGGGQARSAQAALQDLQQQQALQFHTRLQLQADLAGAYLALRGQQQQLALQQGLVDAWQHTAVLQLRRAQAGLATLADSHAAQAEAASAAARARALARDLAAQRHVLQALLGTDGAGLLEAGISATPDTPDTAAAPAVPAAPLALPTLPQPGPDTVVPAIPPGLPSALLARRPDLAAAQHAVQAARLRLGVAQASAWPSLRLTASGGVASAELGTLLRSAARSWSLAGLLSLPLFDGGRRDARQAAAQADLALAAAQWRGQMLQALREVDDQLSALHTLQAQAAALARADAASAQALALQQGLLARGLASPLPVLDAQRRLLADRQALAQVQTARLLATVALVRALGGGWGDADRSPPGPASPAAGTNTPMHLAAHRRAQAD